MTLKAPYPAELLRVARKVVWYDQPEQTLADLGMFLSHLMAYGSPSDLTVARRYVPDDEFRNALEVAPAGIFTREIWQKWHQEFGIPLKPLPRRRFPDGTYGPEPGNFFGR